MYAPDLRTVLKNLARNALQALSRRESPRRLAFQIELQLEMTGEESVLISLVDNAAPLAAEVVETPRPQSGLWLVQQTLRQYDGALTLDPNPTQADYTKALVVRLFRV